MSKGRIGYPVYILDSTADRNFGEAQDRNLLRNKASTVFLREHLVLRITKSTNKVKSMIDKPISMRFRCNRIARVNIPGP